MFIPTPFRKENYITLAQFDDICNSKKYKFNLEEEEKKKLLKNIVK